MAASLRSICSTFATIRNYSGRFKGAIAALLLVLPVLGTLASAQTTTISGTVYDPRTTASALPLPNVLVYVTTGTVAPFVAGAQCLTTSAPSGVTSYTNTAVDGTFTLTGVPVNATYTLVIQAGKWRRQFAVAVVATPLTGLLLHMPSNHTQGDIPMIAIATGSVDALECVLLDMGIDATEFTDDNQTVNAGGHIHLYKGSESPGADINASTPSQSVLMNASTTLNGYDMVMFPCQGSAGGQTSPTGATNLLNFANAGGRVFATHYSFAWLDPNAPYDSQFPPVANWVGDTSFNNETLEATINTGFNDGATLAQWLLNAGASTTYGQVALSTVRNDFSSVIPPTQSWAMLNSNNDIMQMTFNAPVGATAANQCGRVLFNEYHVENASGITGDAFPGECIVSAAMSPQEEMLEYALFDLSSFVTPVVVPTLSITFSPSPMVVDQDQSGDQVTVDVTNTSTTAAIDGTAVLTIALPVGITATGLADSTGGWICTVNTLTCTRTTGIAASGSDSVTLTVSVTPYPTGGPASPTGLISVTVSSPNFSNNVTATDTVIFQQPPPITWATPAPITYGTALSGAQLDATSTLAGSFSYSPAAGTVLGIGPQTLTATFTPTNAADYTTGTATVTLTVVPATPVITLTSSSNDGFASDPVTFTVTITSSGTPPTGTVSVYDGTTLLGTATVTAGVATFTTSALPAGTDSITAVYSGDSSYQGVTSGPISETIEDFKIALAGNASGTSTAYSGGQPATYPLVITPVGGATLAGAVSMSVTGLPTGATVVFTPATVAVNSGVSSVSVQVSLPGQPAAQLLRRSFGGGSLQVALGLILLPFAGRLRKGARRWNRLLLLAVISAALAVGLTGCLKVSSTPQTYSLTITGTSGSLSHSTPVKLIVQLAQN